MARAPGGGTARAGLGGFATQSRGQRAGSPAPRPRPPRPAAAAIHRSARHRSRGRSSSAGAGRDPRHGVRRRIRPRASPGRPQDVLRLRASVLGANVRRPIDLSRHARAAARSRPAGQPADRAASRSGPPAARQRPGRHGRRRSLPQASAAARPRRPAPARRAMPTRPGKTGRAPGIPGRAKSGSGPETTTAARAARCSQASKPWPRAGIRAGQKPRQIGGKPGKPPASFRGRKPDRKKPGA